MQEEKDLRAMHRLTIVMTCGDLARTGREQTETVGTWLTQGCSWPVLHRGAS